jgi:phosphatidylglycerol:prolipoprotein diacylglycerol transferase
MLGWRVVPGVEVGPLSISPHGLGIALGYFVGAWLMARRARRAGFDEDHTWNAAAWGVVGAIAGARVAYVVGHLDAFESPLEWLKIWEGGISLIGGLLGGMLAVALYLRRHRLSFLRLGDLGAPGLALGIAVGRSGDLIIGDHLGKPASGWWGWVYEGGELISPPPCVTPEGRPVYPSVDGCIEPGMAVHQTALYDAVWSLVIFGILLWLARPGAFPARRTGFLFLTWAFLYGLGRVVTDFLRVDKTWLFGLTGSQITSLLAVALCGYLLLRYRGGPGWQLEKAEVGVASGPEPSPVGDEESERT